MESCFKSDYNYNNTPLYDNPMRSGIRNSNLELLRILSMMLIIAHHFAYHGGFTSAVTEANRVWLDTIIVGGKLGVNLFIMISGYFLIDSKFKPVKLLKLVLQVIFYIVLLYFISIWIEGSSFDKSDFIKELMSVVTAMRYWFIPVYIIVYILSPYLKKVVENCSRKELLFLITFLIFIQVVIPELYDVSYLSDVGWFLSLYLFGSYIRIYKNEFFDDNIIMTCLFLVSLALMITYKVNYKTVMYELKDVPCLTATISLFCWFKNLNIKNSKAVNLVSSTTLGIYLFHDNGCFRPHLWEKLLHCTAHETLPFVQFFCYSFISVILVFVIGAVLDIIRQLLFYYCGKLINLIRKKAHRSENNRTVKNPAF